MGAICMQEHFEKLQILVNDALELLYTYKSQWKHFYSLICCSQFFHQAQEETMAVFEISTSLSSMSVSTPWAGIVANSDHKALDETLTDSASTDMFWDSNVTKSGENEIQISDATFLTCSQIDSMEDDNFIEAKDTKKSRKRSAKAKGATTKVSVPAASQDLSVGSNFIVKGNRFHQLQLKEMLPIVPFGPYLGDFVIWKGESTNPSPAPAWSTDTVKLQKPTSLRDILKEQQRIVSSVSQGTPMPTPQKPGISQLACELVLHRRFLPKLHPLSRLTL